MVRELSAYDERYGCLAYLRLIVRKFTKLGLPLWCSHCQESPVLKVEGSRGSFREMDQMFNLFVRNRMVWLEDICGATVFDYVLQCLTDWFRETRCFAELNQRAAGVSVPRVSPGTYPCRPSRRQPLLPGHQSTRRCVLRSLPCCN